MLRPASGIRAGEAETGGARRGLLILGLRKNTPRSKAIEIVEQWLELKHRVGRKDPESAERLYGVDRVSHDVGFNFDQHAPALRLAEAAGQLIKSHAGEFWEDGRLMDALRLLETFVASRLLHVVTNTLALTPDPATLSSRYYTAENRREIAEKQESIINDLASQKTFVELSPKSNEVVSRRTREREYWIPRRMDYFINRGLRIVLTDDDPGIFETNLPLEYVRVALGWSPYGPVAFRTLEALLKNSRRMAEEMAPGGPVRPKRGANRPLLLGAAFIAFLASAFTSNTHAMKPNHQPHAGAGLSAA